MSEELESITRGIYSRKERESLRVLARKITKTPKSINIPVEYMIENKDKC